VRHDDANRLGEIIVQRRGDLLLLGSIHLPSPNSGAGASGTLDTRQAC
jgi:hypothetical protein